jgi:hypothetical protein
MGHKCPCHTNRVALATQNERSVSASHARIRSCTMLPTKLVTACWQPQQASSRPVIHANHRLPLQALKRRCPPYLAGRMVRDLATTLGADDLGATPPIAQGGGRSHKGRAAALIVAC